jgi:hypothetical protein
MGREGSGLAQDARVGRRGAPRSRKTEMQGLNSELEMSAWDCMDSCMGGLHAWEGCMRSMGGLHELLLLQGQKTGGCMQGGVGVRTCRACMDLQRGGQRAA